MPSAVTPSPRPTLPGWVARAGRPAWHAARTLVRLPAARIAWERAGRPATAVIGAGGIGDDLLCTAVLREWTRRGLGPLVMATPHPELFVGNADARVIGPRDPLLAGVEHFGARVLQLTYGRYDAASDHSLQPSRHIVADMCAQAGLAGEIAVRPYLQVSTGEQEAVEWARDAVVVQSTGLASRYPMPNREWFPDRFAEMIRLVPGRAFVQIGSARDPLLPGATDLRGRTGLRESAAILSVAALYVGTVGLLMHLARAVDCPAVVVYGGREAPWQSGYTCNVNLASALPCAPCWRYHTCEFDRECMTRITPAIVAAAVRDRLAQPRGPLAVDRLAV